MPTIYAVWRYTAEAEAAERGESLQAVIAAAEAGKLGVCFSGAGFGAACQLGAAQVLTALGLLGPLTPVSGASAGSIVAVSTRCSLSYLEVLDALDSVAQDLLQHGEKKRMRKVLRAKMTQLLPPNAYQLCSSGSPSPHTQARYTVVAAGPPQDAAGQHSHTQHRGSDESRYACNYDSQGSTSSTAAYRPEQPQQQQQQQQERHNAHTAVGVRGSSNGALVSSSTHDNSSSSSTAAIVIGATRVRPACGACVQPDVFLGGYASNDELLDLLVAGSHIPRTSDGSLFARFKGHRYMDAGVRDPCPPIPGVQHTVIIYPCHSGLLTRFWPYKVMLKPPPPHAIAISPGQHGRPWPYTKDYKANDKLIMHPQPSGVLRALFERGRRDTLAWAQHIGLTAEVVLQLRSLHPSQAQQRATAAPVSSEAAPAAPSALAAGTAQLEGEAAVLHSWLQMPVEQLPMLVHVPQDQMHLL